jgi:signal transduction histidine kinase/ligand-binding sensor domain-containing protein/CheY-like chemotaxis protein/HPt (histidine-containing phosphotransfer) domain-containing protein
MWLKGLLGLLLVVSVSLAAKETLNFNFTPADISKQLSQKTIRQVYQDHTGYIWVVTQEGLSRYDGYQLLSFTNDPRHPDSISSDNVRAIAEDQQKRLWIATDGGGLNLYNPARQNFSTWQESAEPNKSPSSNRMQSLHVGKLGEIWIGYRDGNFSRFDPERQTFEHFNTRQLLPALENDAAITSITDDGNTVWLTTNGNGLLIFDKKSTSLTRLHSGSQKPLFSDRLTHVFIDNQQRLWLASYDAGISMGDPQRATFRRWLHQAEQSDSIAANLVHFIYQDKQQRIWVATEAGASVWNGRDKFASFTSTDGLAHDKVLSIYQDMSGLMWFGTFHGLSNGIEVPFEHFNQGLASNVIMGFAETTSSAGETAIWVASYGGLSRLNKEGEVQQVLTKESTPALQDARVMTALGDDNFLWFGTRAGGLGRLNVDNDQIDYFTHDPNNAKSLSFNGVTSIYQDSSGNIWVGTFGGGLNLLEAGSSEFKHFRHQANDPRSLNNDRVLAVYQLVTGAIVVGTVSGMNVLDPLTLEFDHIENQADNFDSLSAPMAWSFYQDKRARLWVGTQGGGLNLWQPEDIKQRTNYFTHYDSNNGLPSSHIYSILDDDNGHLWLSSTQGLTRMDLTTGAMRHFDTYQGLKDSEFNFGAGFKDSQGNMYFGGNSGFVRFHPNNIKDNQVAPPVVLIRIKKLNEQVWFDVPYQQLQNLELGYQDYFISFEFAALDYHAPGLNQYRYKLEGLDSDWIELEHRRLATFTNLPAGDYVLRAQASNNQGLWNTLGVSLPISVLPPPWKTLWAYSLYTLVIGLIILNFIWRFRKKRLLEIQQLIELEDKVAERTKELLHANEQLGQSMLETDKARLAAEQASREKSDFLAIMSHEIRTPMNGVLGMTEVLLSSDLKPKQQHFAQLANRSGRLLLDLLNNILDYSKLEAGKADLESVPLDLAAMLEDVCDLFSETAHNKGLNINPIMAAGTPSMVLADPARLRQILANLTSNAIKFTESGEVNISLALAPLSSQADANATEQQDHCVLQFQVQDTGIGMELDRQHKVFEMFTQADASTTRKYGGTGLGLAICKQLTNLMGGDLTLQSTPGLGSTFTLELTLPVVTTKTAENTTALPANLTAHLVNLQGGLSRSIEALLEQYQIKMVHVQRVNTEIATAKNGIWFAQSACEAEIRRCGIENERWICLLPSSQWQEDDQRNVLTLPLHKDAVLHCIHKALGLAKLKTTGSNKVGHHNFKATILVAEDSITNQEVAKSMLALLGCEVWLADNGKEAVAQVQDHLPDLVLMDCQMPIMDGYEASRAIRQKWPELPIVALTAGMGDNLKQDCLEAGMNDVMSKPFSLQELEQTLARFLAVKGEIIASELDEDDSEAKPQAQDIEPESPKLLDMSTIDTLQKISRDTGNPVFDRVLDAFTSEASVLSKTLCELAQSAQPELALLAEQAHALKSMAGNTGALALYELCRELETKLKAQDINNSIVLVEQIPSLFQASLSALEQFRHDS